MPTGNEDLGGALMTALQMCWNESIGYEMGGTFNPDTDCSGFVWRALHENGFDVGASRFDTTTEYNILVNAGFTPLVWGIDTTTPQHGDIFMYDEGGGARGHTFFYVENVYGYSDPTARTNAKAMLQRARVEASSSRESGYEYPNDPDTIPGDVNNPDAPGDHPRNGVGAYWEVWVHAFSGNSPVYGAHTWYVFRWGTTPPGPIPPGPFPPGNMPFWLLKKIRDHNFTKEGY